MAELRVALLLDSAKHLSLPLATPRAPVTARTAAHVHTLTAAQLAEARRNPRRQTVLVASHGSRVVGLLRCVAARSTSLALPGQFALVTTVFVRPAYRRNGVLRRLLDAADAWARARGLPEMRLHCAVRNRIGNAAWASLGFTPVEVLHRRAVPPESPAR